MCSFKRYEFVLVDLLLCVEIFIYAHLSSKNFHWGICSFVLHFHLCSFKKDEFVLVKFRRCSLVPNEFELEICSLVLNFSTGLIEVGCICPGEFSSVAHLGIFSRLIFIGAYIIRMNLC